MIEFYLSLANLIIITNLIIIAFYIYRLIRKHKASLPWVESFRLLLIFPIVLVASRLVMFLDYTINIPLSRVVFEWFVALMISMVSYKFSKILDLLFQFEHIRTYADENEGLKKQLFTIQEAYLDLQTQNKFHLSAINRLEHVLTTKMWLYDRKKTVEELNKVLSDLNESKQ